MLLLNVSRELWMKCGMFKRAMHWFLGSLDFDTYITSRGYSYSDLFTLWRIASDCEQENAAIELTQTSMRQQFAALSASNQIKTAVKWISRYRARRTYTSDIKHHFHPNQLLTISFTQDIEMMIYLAIRYHRSNTRGPIYSDVTRTSVSLSMRYCY